jgi:hypothetical protein
MSTEKKDNNKIVPPKAPKGNYQLWVILVTVAVILGVMYLNSSNNLKVIEQADLQRMLESGDVKKVVLIKEQELVEVTLTADALKNSKYTADIEEGPMGANTEGRTIKSKSFQSIISIIGIATYAFPINQHYPLKHAWIISAYLFSGDFYSCCYLVSGC